RREMCFIGDSLKALILHSLSPLSECSSLRERDELLQASLVRLSKSHNGLSVVQLSTVLPEEMELLADDQRHHIELMHPLVLRCQLPSTAFRGQGEERLAAQHLVKLPQVVEADGWLGLLLQATSNLRVRMQITQ